MVSYLGVILKHWHKSTGGMKAAKEANPSLRPFNQGRCEKIWDGAEIGLSRYLGGGKIRVEKIAG